MRRRGKAGGRLAKARRGKAMMPKRNDKVRVTRPKSAAAVLEEKLKLQARELDDARNERAAFAEVLRIISASPGALEPVFKAILENATRICDAKFGTLLVSIRLSHEERVGVKWK